jgi:beta-1,4-N-acetylglucosaminyltransferase
VLKRKKIGIITSKGGHLVAIRQLISLFNKYPHFWVTFKGEDSEEYLQKEVKYYAYFPESRNIVNAIRNTFLAFKILLKEKPTILISSGAGIAVPFFLVGKVLNMKLIFIETYDYVKYPSLTGKILYNMVDLFLVQHKVQKKWYPKAKYWGSLL